MKKPDFQRFLTAFLCGTPDRVPLAETDVDRSIGFAQRLGFWGSQPQGYGVALTLSYSLRKPLA